MCLSQTNIESLSPRSISPPTLRRQCKPERPSQNAIDRQSFLPSGQSFIFSQVANENSPPNKLNRTQRRQPNEAIGDTHRSHAGGTFTKSVPSQINSVSEKSLLYDASESFEEAVSIIRKGVKEYNCLRKALILYMILIKMKMISMASIHNNSPDDNFYDYSFYSRSILRSILNFLRYYPTLVGWIFLAVKFKRYLFLQDTMSIYHHCETPLKNQPNRRHGSTNTCATVSSQMSTMHEDHMELEMADSWGYFTDPSGSQDSKVVLSLASGSRCSDCREEAAVNEQNSILQSDLSLGYLANTASFSMDVDVAEDSIYNNNNSTDDWGFFADFPEEEDEKDVKPNLDGETRKDEINMYTEMMHSMPKEYYNTCIKYLREGVEMFSYD